MTTDTSLIAEFIKTIKHTHELHELGLIDEAELCFTKTAAINITLYSCALYEQEQLEDAIITLHHEGLLSKEDYWQIKARLGSLKNAA